MSSVLKRLFLVLVVIASVFSFPASETSSADKVIATSEVVVARRKGPKNPVSYFDSVKAESAPVVNHQFAVDVKSLLVAIQLTSQQSAISRSCDLQQLVVDLQHKHSLLSC
jgi:hypothetical protein